MVSDSGEKCGASTSIHNIPRWTNVRPQPVARSSTINLLLTYAVQNNFLVKQADYSAAALFVRRGKPLDGEERGKIECIISTYVDDCLVCVRDEATWEKLIEDMKNQYKDSKVKTFSSDPGPLTHALGMHVIRGDGWIELSHEDAINNLIDEYGVRKMPGKFTPLASTKTPLTKADCPIVKTPIQF